MFYLIFVIFSFIFELYGRFQEYLTKPYEERWISFPLGTINTIMEFLVNVLITCTLFKVSYKKLLLLTIDALNSRLAKYGFTKNKKAVYDRTYYVLDLSCCVMLVIDFIQSIYSFTILYRVAPFKMFDSFYRLRVTTFSYYLCSLIRKLWQRIHHVNEIVDHLISSQKYNFQEDCQSIINDISILHNKFLEAIMIFNDIFGWILFCLYINYVFLFLISFELSLLGSANPYLPLSEIYLTLSTLMLSALVSKNNCICTTHLCLIYKYLFYLILI